MSVKRTIKFVRWLEMALQNTGWFVLLHDGTQRKESDQIQNPTFFTRTYRMNIDGQMVNTWVKFIYDYRDGWADFMMSYTPTNGHISSREYASRKMVIAMQKSQEGDN